MTNTDIADKLIANSFAIERTGFQNNHERVLCALLREAAVALGWKEKCVMCGAKVMTGSIFYVGHKRG